MEHRLAALFGDGKISSTPREPLLESCVLFDAVIVCRPTHHQNPYTPMFFASGCAMHQANLVWTIKRERDAFLTTLTQFLKKVTCIGFCAVMVPTQQIETMHRVLRQGRVSRPSLGDVNTYRAKPLPENYFFGPSLNGTPIVQPPPGREGELPGGQIAPEGHLRKTMLST